MSEICSCGALAESWKFTPGGGKRERGSICGVCFWFFVACD